MVHKHLQISGLMGIGLQTDASVLFVDPLPRAAICTEKAGGDADTSLHQVTLPSLITSLFSPPLSLSSLAFSSLLT